MSQSSIADSEKLAINGGQPCVVDKPVSYAHGPWEIGDEEIELVTKVMRSKQLFRFGKKQEDSVTWQFEQQFSKETQVEHALAVNAGTSALICALVGLGVSTGDEVIVPGYTYIATAAAVLACGGIPVIAEIDDSLTLDPDDVERKITPRTKVIAPVHMRGVPSQMDRIMAVAKKHNVRVLEDCAQANGASFKGKPVGSIGHAGIFSLQQFKIITAGEGGCFVTNDREVYERGACYHDSAYTFWMERQEVLTKTKPFLGENYRMSEVNGAIALVQLRKRAAILARTRAIKKRLVGELQDLPGISWQRVPCEEGDCGIGAAFLCETPARAKKIAEALGKEGMAANSLYDKGIPDRHIYYHWNYVMEKRSPDVYGRPWNDPERPAQVEYTNDMCPQTLDILGRVVVMPISQTMSDAHVESCIKAVKKVTAAL